MGSVSALSLVIEQSNPEKLYLQIEQQLKAFIAEERLTAGDKLPSSRVLCEQLGVSRTTVTKAYENLVAEGFLVSRPKRGLYVAEQASELITAKKALSLAAVEDTRITPKNTFSSAACVSLFPFKSWANAMRSAWLNIDAESLISNDSSGYWPLKIQIAEYLKSLRGLDVSPRQILITAGNRDALTLLSSTLLANPGTQVVLENPCYPKMTSLFSTLGKEINYLNVDDEGVQLPEKALSGLGVITPNRQYPLGVQMSSNRRQQWLDYLGRQGENQQRFWLIEDDYDSEFIYKGRAISPFMAQDKTQSTFLVGSFSKAIFPALRLGYIVSPAAMSEHLEACQKRIGSSASLGLQPALAQFMEAGELASHLRKMRRHYNQNRQLLREILAPLTFWMEIQQPAAGMHLVAVFKPKWQGLINLDSEIAEQVNQQGIVLDLLSSHYAKGKQQGFVFGFSQIGENPELAVAQLVVTIERLINKKRPPEVASK